MQGSNEWKDRRSRCASTCSEYANALGIGYVSRQKYMRTKLGIDAPQEANWRMQQGNLRENWVCELYYRLMHRFGADISLSIDGFHADPQDWRFGGSVDRVVQCNKTGEQWVLECKTCPDGDMRVEVPTGHLLQMLGLCHAYNLPKAHYICWSQHQGILLAEVTFAPTLWSNEIYPRLKQFGDWWALRQIPPQMSKIEKDAIVMTIRDNCHVREISAASTWRQQQPQ